MQFHVHIGAYTVEKRYSRILLGSLILRSCAGTRPAGIGIIDGKLTTCPASPNCVSSQSPDKVHSIAPLRHEDTAAEARLRLLAVISSFPRTRIVTLLDNYIHCEFTSALFRFVDDVEFFFEEGGKVIHVRSASRVGYSDLGANRRRIEKIREKF
jgi:uncharacterized protein (DUF1499 family)